jgi:hypothetical protein
VRIDRASRWIFPGTYIGGALGIWTIYAF